MITMIKIDNLLPHPQNPRQDVGDVTELAESIKAKGIMQNLTVVPFVSKVNPKFNGKGRYTVIIGHRRLAAAKLAGLAELPCVITEMTEQEQISTMLLENMQRSDLTVYEQAQGFQMMFDLGETMSSISKSTGFSETTIRHRIKLLELDKDKFQKSEARNPNISDYIELEKVKDIKRRNKCLEKIGTNDFDWELKRAIQDEENAEKRAKWCELLDSVAEKVPGTERNRRTQLTRFYMLNDITEESRLKIIELVDSEEKLYWVQDNYNYAYLLGKEKTTKQDNTYAEEQKRRQAKIATVAEVEKTAWELRRKFVKNFVGTRIEHFPIVFKRLVEEFFDFGEVDFKKLAEMLNIYIPEEKEDDDDYDVVKLVLENYKMDEMISKRPQKLVLTLLFLLNDETANALLLHSWNGEYRKNKRLEEWYDFLCKLGYEISAEEKQLLDGTHGIFKEDKP